LSDGSGGIPPIDYTGIFRGNKMHSYTFVSRHETGNKLLDSEHKQLFQLIGECSAMALNGATCEYLMSKLNELYGRLESHFLNEEKLMAVLGTKQTEMHKNQHLNLLVMLKKNIIHFADKETKINAVQKVLADLFDWYETHIEYEDKKLALHIENAASARKLLKEPA
jgi:hemerythrin-like metal-binding protein